MPPARSTIRFKMLCAFFFLVLVVTCALASVSLYRNSQLIRREVEKRGIAVTKTFTQMAANYIFEMDFITVLDNAREIIDSSDIRAITVVDADRKVWISTDAEKTETLPAAPIFGEAIRSRTLQLREIRTNSHRTLEFVNPILAMGKVAYLVHMEISMQAIEKQLAASIRNIFLLSFGMLLLAALMAVFISKLLTAPLKKLVRGTQEISRGNLDFRIQPQSQDEIGELALAFNRMADNLNSELAERRQAEIALRKHRDHLEVRVEARTAAIKKAMEKLQLEIRERKAAEESQGRLEARLQRAQKMEAIGTLAGGVAHDLNNILAGIVSYPDLLLMQLPPDSPLQNPIKTIRESGRKAAAIVQDLLTLARRGVAATQVVNLNDVVQEYLQSPECRKLCEQHPGIRLNSDLEAELLNIIGSPVHLDKAIMNLVGNGIEAMPGGGVLSVATQNRHLEKAVAGFENVPPGDYVVLTIADSGTGIEAEDVERIFEPFYTKKIMGKSGTGLGMAVVWGTVKDHRGYIDVDTTVGGGTTFTLYFPVTRRLEAESRCQPDLQDLNGAGETILVVDDVPEQREIACAILAQLGYRVTAVADGKSAIDHLRHTPVDLLVLDMIMPPGIDGLDTFKRVLGIRPGQKTIIVSVFSESERVKKARGRGAWAYVRKPYLISRLGLAVKTALARGQGPPCQEQPPAPPSAP